MSSPKPEAAKRETEHSDFPDTERYHPIDQIITEAKYAVRRQNHTGGTGKRDEAELHGAQFLEGKFAQIGGSSQRSYKISKAVALFQGCQYISRRNALALCDQCGQLANICLVCLIFLQNEGVISLRVKLTELFEFCNYVKLLLLFNHKNL